MSYINKEDLLATINEAWERKYSNCDLKAVYDVYRMIVKKINGAEEIVKCKHCKNKYTEVNQCGHVYCGLHKGWFNKNAFCSYGKRE